MVAARGARNGRLRAVEVEVEAARSGLRLALVLARLLARAVRVLDRLVHAHERDLTDRHAVVDRDREVRHVRELERDVPAEARVDEAGCRVDEQAEAAERALALESRDEVVRQRDALERLAEHELAGVEDE